ncbi:hypothetical protein [Breznakia pachnodae]|uniref:DUF5348 domain-containing protein n=1 Tax=Breznakia pachnodae TaxID=265178 RepID=A0ABU0E1H4_9FIRM|nr:hypothetical protein [Breznakia pachnodae]MDQ0360619.1 hypothetical protein [Breznakia pachnodae]
MEKDKIIENNISLHKLLTTELLQNHSIAALMQLIEMGREIELRYNDEVISITRLNDKLILADNDNSLYFDDVWSLVIKGEVGEGYFVNYWNKMSVKVLF